MRTKIFSVINHKGGVGKSTISTNLAGYLANQDKKVLLGDFDIQQSSFNWLNQRSEHAKKIHHWAIHQGRLETPDDDVDYIVIDSPAGVSNEFLHKFVGLSDKVIVPLGASLFDILSTESFLEEIVDIINKQEKNTDICLIGNMVDHRTIATAQLKKFIYNSGLKVPTTLKQSQVYVELAAHGLTLFDGKNSKSEFFKEEKEDWKPLIDWLLDREENSQSQT
jgi:chromosome partitioning protein